MECVNAWLVTYIITIAGETFERHVVFSAESAEMAEAAACHTGRHWWPHFREEHDGCTWCFRAGDVWLSGIFRLDLTEREVLGDLGITDFYDVTGCPDAPEIE